MTIVNDCCLKCTKLILQRIQNNDDFQAIISSLNELQQKKNKIKT